MTAALKKPERAETVTRTPDDGNEQHFEIF